MEPKEAAKKPAKKKSAKKSVPKVKTFADHLERIRKAKAESDALAADIPMDAARASVAVLYEMVFDYLCGSGELGVSEFNTLAGVIQKLAASRVQLGNADLKEGQNGAQDGPSGSLSEEALAKIEEQLRLM